MKFKGLDGKEYAKDISKYKREQDKPNASKGEKLLAEALDKMFPNMVYQELPCVGTKLRLDFYIHLLKMAFEFDGSQHDEYVPHFHGSRKKFAQAKNRDWEKEEWCKINGIRLIRIKESEVNNLKELISEH